MYNKVKQPGKVVSKLKLEHILARTSSIHGLRESDVDELDDHCGTVPKLEYAELSHINLVEAIDYPKNIVVRVSNNLTSINEDNMSLRNQNSLERCA